MDVQSMTSWFDSIMEGWDDASMARKAESLLRPQIVGRANRHAHLDEWRGAIRIELGILPIPQGASEEDARNFVERLRCRLNDAIESTYREPEITKEIDSRVCERLDVEISLEKVRHQAKALIARAREAAETIQKRKSQRVSPEELKILEGLGALRKAFEEEKKKEVVS